jgi:phosphoadenosine phosphosulfate reductase
MEDKSQNPHYTNSLTRLKKSPFLRKMIEEEYKGEIAVLSSFGAESALVLFLVSEIDPNIPVFFLETKKHFSETLQYKDALKNKLGLTNIIDLYPHEDLENSIDPHGTLWKENPNRCCWLRKVEPLERGLKRHKISTIITGRKNFQTKDRENIKNIEIDEKGIIKVNPLIHLTQKELSDCLKSLDLPEHPLLKKSYPSIGCAPCTSPVKKGEDPRSGRWAHTKSKDGLTQKTECGIHISDKE